MTSPLPRTRLRTLLQALLPAALLHTAAAGADPRDPLQAPPAALTAPPGAPAGVGAPASSPTAGAAAGVTSIIGNGDDRAVVVGSRRYKRGDLLDGVRIERIDDSGYWLRQGNASRRIDLFPGVRKHALPLDPVAPTRTVSR